jgi:hypothetical protein
MAAFTDRTGALRLTALAAALTVAACNPAFREGIVERLPTPWRPVPEAETPVIFQSRGAPKLIEAQARAVSDAYRSWRLVYANTTDLPGENRLAIDIATRYDSGLAMFVRPERPWPQPLYTETGLTAALKAEFEGLSSGIAEAGRRNRYGVYDYAVGRGTRGTCVLAWQLIDDHVRVLPETVDAIHMEWRQCDRAKPVEELLAPFDTLTLAPELGILEDKGAGKP